MNLLVSDLILFNQPLERLPDSKLLINTINAHSYTSAQNDAVFAEALQHSDVLLPDGIGIVLATRFIKGTILKKIAGYDLFIFEMTRLNTISGTCFFLGSDHNTLRKIVDRAKIEFPNVKVFTYSPPFKETFLQSENVEMIDAINKVQPDVLFIGLTAPKQEKWAYLHFSALEVGHVCCIGAVFDFYSMRIKRAPDRLIHFGLEWFYRFIIEPKRMWRRYLIGNIKFIWLIIREKIKRKDRDRN